MNSESDRSSGGELALRNDADTPQVSRRGLVTLSAGAAALAMAGSVAMPKPAMAEETGDQLNRILKSGTLRLGQFLQYPPYGFKNPSGEPDGFDVDISKMIAADMGVKLELIDSTWDGIIPGLLSGKYDMVGANMAITMKRSLAVDFSIPHVYTTTGFLIRDEDSTKFPDLNSINDAAVTVSVLIQDASRQTLERFFPNAKILEFNTSQDAVLAMQTKKVNIACSEISFLYQYAHEHAGLKVIPVNIPGSSTLEALAMLPGPDSAHLRSFIDTWIRFYFWTGRCEALWKKWLPWNQLPKLDKFLAPV